MAMSVRALPSLQRFCLAFADNIPRCTDDDVHFMLITLTVDESSRSHLLHLFGKDLDIVLAESF